MANKPEPSHQFWHGVLTNVAAATLVATGFFFFLSASRVDFISILGFDNILGTKNIFGLSERDYVWKLLVNLIVAFGLGFVFVAFRQNVRLKAALTAEDSRTSETSTLKIGDEASPYEPMSQRDIAISYLNKRIATLRLRATTIYWTMILSLVTGVILIIFAGYLSSFDTTFSTLSSKIDADRQDAALSMARYIAQKSATGPNANDTTAYDYLLNRIKTVDKSYSDLMAALIQQTSERAENKPVWNWPSTILRVGVIGLLVFLTYILIDLYRYNSRLIAFYGSRRDALLLCGDKLEKLEGLAELLYPAKLDFGKEPRHPFQEIGELVRDTGARLAKRSKRKNSNGPVKQA